MTTRILFWVVFLYIVPSNALDFKVSNSDELPSLLVQLLDSSDQIFERDFNCDHESDSMLRFRVAGLEILMPNRFTVRPLLDGVMHAAPRHSASFDKLDGAVLLGMDSISFYLYKDIESKPAYASVKSLLDKVEFRNLGADVKFGSIDERLNSGPRASHNSFILTDGIEIMIWSGSTARNWRTLVACIIQSSSTP